MTIGRLWPAATSEFTDPLSGVALRCLTAYRGHSHHFYFTNPGWCVRRSVRPLPRLALQD